MSDGERERTETDDRTVEDVHSDVAHLRGGRAADVHARVAELHRSNPQCALDAAVHELDLLLDGQLGGGKHTGAVRQRAGSWGGESYAC